MFERVKAAWSAFRRPGVKMVQLQDLFGGILQGIEISQFRNYESYLQAGSKKIWALYKACDLIGKVCMDTTGILSKIGGDGSRVKNADLDRLLSAPNEFETFGEMIYKWVFHMLLCGNAFWTKDESNGQGQRPKAIFQLNPKRMRVSVDARLGVVGYIYTNFDGEQIPYDVEEIMHFRLPHPNNDFWGVGAVEAAEPLFNEAINRDLWQENFWKNGASPSGLMILEDVVVDKGKWEEAKAEFNRRYSGLKNAGKTILLTGKWKHEQLGLTAQEMQNIEQSKWTVEQIFMQLGVPLSVAGVREAANYNCIPAGELVETPLGPVAIENLKQGDPIWQWSKDGLTKGAVVAIIPQKAAPIFEIKTQTRTLKASANHPVLGFDLKWRRADQLAVNDRCLTAMAHGFSGERIISVRQLPSEPVFDLAATNEHTFIAGGIVVHNTAEKDDIRFRRYTIKPLLKFAEDTINSDLVEGYGGNLEYRFNVQGLIDLGNILQTFAPLFDRGVISINEMRDAVGLPKIMDDPLFDQHFITAALVPLELAGVAAGDQTQQAARAIMQRFIDSSLCGQEARKTLESISRKLIDLQNGMNRQVSLNVEAPPVPSVNVEVAAPPVPEVNVEVKVPPAKPVGRRKVSLKRGADGEMTGSIEPE